MRSWLLPLFVLVACSRPPAGVETSLDAGEVHDAGEPLDPCDTVTCEASEQCVVGTCQPRACGVRACTTGELCVDGGCLAAECLNTTCLTREVCVQGACVPMDCASQTCGAGTACVDGACLDTRCLGVACEPGFTCAAGQCLATTCADAGVCAPGTSCVDGACVDTRCVGVMCTSGQQCDAGACVAGCTASQSVESRCANGVDDDCDGLSDCADPDCSGQTCNDDAKPCTRDVCNAGNCTHPAAAAGTVCRASAGGCDLAETCTGASTSCPSDVFDATCACPYRAAISGYSEHDGLRTIAAGNFALRDTKTWAANTAAIDALQLPKVGLDVLPLNRTATRMGIRPWPGFGGGFFWESGDLTVPYWIPQGLAGGTAGARSLVAVSWHYDETDNATDPSPPTDGTDKGVRLSFADVTDLSGAITYRHVLLVEPDAGRGFKPVTNHAGGLAWAGSYLYVADTSRGVRVFDLSRILQVSSAAACSTKCGVSGGTACAYGYSYILPQVGAYVFPTGLSSSCRPLFSYVALDRSTTPPTILSGEYDNDPTWGLYSRVLRWPLTAGTGRLAVGPSGVVKPTGAWFAGSRNLQGAIASGPKFFLNSTRYSGALMTGPVGAASTVLRADQNDYGWMPEGMYISSAGNLWVSTEGHANLERSVFFVRIANVP